MSATLRAARVTISLALALGLVAACGDDEGSPVTAPDATVEGSATTDQSSARKQECELVAFTPNSDNGAFEIEATGTSCETARAVATAAEREQDAFEAEGFQCSGEPVVDAELPGTRWTCTSDGATITFVTS